MLAVSGNGPQHTGHAVTQRQKLEGQHSVMKKPENNSQGRVI